MGLYRRGKIWYYRLYVDGREIRRSSRTSNKNLAQMLFNKKKLEIAQGRLGIEPKRVKITFQEMANLYLEVYAKSHKKPRSYKRDTVSLKQLNRAFGNRQLSHVEPLAIEQYKTKRLREGVTHRTVDIELALLSHIFTKAMDWDKISLNPMRKVKLFRKDIKRTRFLNPDTEYPRLIEVSPEPLRSMILLSIATALRKENLIYLKWRDIDIMNRMLNLKDTKGGRLDLPLSNYALSIIQRQPKYGAYLFSKKNGVPYGDPKKSFKEALKKASIEDFHWQDLRHTAGSYMAMAGIPLKAIQEIMGHKRIETTMRYAHLLPTYRDQATETLADYMTSKIGKNEGQPAQKPAQEKDDSP